MFETELTKKVKDYVRELYEKKNSGLHCYHNVIHACEVVDVISEISEVMKLNEEDKEALIIAGWFHDCGYFETVKGHEEVSTRYAEEFLSTKNYPVEKIEKVKSFILATKVPTNPKNVAEQIICDADLHHLGKTSIEEKSELFRMELEKKGLSQMSDIEWIENNIRFLREHSFYTDYARATYEGQKKLNLLLFEKKLKKMKRKLEKKSVE